MTEHFVLQPQSFQVLHHVYDALQWRSDSYRELRADWPVLALGRETTPEVMRFQLLRVNAYLAKADFQPFPLFQEGDLNAWVWLTYVIDMDVIPIYRDGITVSTTKLLIKPSEVPHLLRFIGVPRTRKGVDVENHNFGYHFHFGNVRRNKLVRTDLLLTFNPGHPVSSSVPLFAEKHGVGSYTAIDHSTIGQNKRRPIYEICHSEMVKRGINNFKRPDHDANVFYPM